MRNNMARMEKTFQHSVNIKPFIIEKIKNTIISKEITPDDLYFIYYKSTFSTSKKRSGETTKGGRYCYNYKDGCNTYYITWQIDEADYFEIITIDEVSGGKTKRIWP
jgi:hypothetical protein